MTTEFYTSIPKDQESYGQPYFSDLEVICRTTGGVPADFVGMSWGSGEPIWLIFNQTDVNGWDHWIYAVGNIPESLRNIMFALGQHHVVINIGQGTGGNTYDVSYLILDVPAPPLPPTPPPAGQGQIAVYAYKNQVEVIADVPLLGKVYKTPCAVNVLPGTYLVIVIYEGVTEQEYVTVADGEQKQLQFSFTGTNAPKPINWMPFIIVGVIAAVGIGVYYWYKRRKKRNELTPLNQV